MHFHEHFSTLLPQQPLPIVLAVTEPRRRFQVIRIDQIHSLLIQLLPHPVPKTYRPRRQVPVSHLDTLGMRNSDLASQPRQLRRIEDPIGIQERPELSRKVGRGDGRDQ